MDEEDKEYYFVVMNSIFPVVTHSKNDFITERFDLKGSTVGRLVLIYYLANSILVLTSFHVCKESVLKQNVLKRGLKPYSKI